MQSIAATDLLTSFSECSFRIIVAVYDNRAAVMPFIHALRIALAAQGELEIVDVRPETERINIIGVRSYLERWNLLPAGSQRSDVATTGIRVQKVVRTGNKKKLIKKRIRNHHHDLLVIGTEERLSRTGVFGSSLAANLAEYFKQTTLFIPYGSRPFIDETSGMIALKRILIPVGNQHFYNCAIHILIQFLAYFPDLRVEVTGLHVGNAFPDIRKQNHKQIHWKEIAVSGPVAEMIAAQADKYCADLVIMATKGRDSLSSSITGSKTERVLDLILCPVLAVSAVLH